MSISTFPEKYDLQRVKSRLLVIQTFLLETDAMLKEELLDDTLFINSKAKLVAAFNALNNQLNELCQQRFDESLLGIDESKDTIEEQKIDNTPK